MESPQSQYPLAATNRRGFVLLIVLAVLVVSAVSLTTLATASHHRSLDARHARDELQRRYAVISCEQLLLPRAAELFEQQDEQWRDSGRSTPPPASIREQVRLGDHMIDLILADEDAKANLNALYHEADRSRVERTLRDLVGPQVQQLLALNPVVRSASRFRQNTADDEEDDGDDTLFAPAFHTWGDIFAIPRLRAATGDDRMLATITANITLWGSGRLNLEHAQDDTVIAVCEAVVSRGVADSLLTAYRDYPQRNVQLLLDKEVADTADRQRLSELIGRGSSAWSLWTEVTSPGFRTQKFSVLHTSPDGRRRTFDFTL